MSLEKGIRYDSYTKKYLLALKNSKSEIEKSFIINQIYEDGFYDGKNSKEK